MKLSFASKNAPPMPPPPPEVVLASQSIGRKMLLQKLGIRFRTTVTRLDEETIIEKDPYLTLKRRAAAKSAEVVNNPRIYSIPEEGETLLITADSMAIVGKKTYGKAKDKEEARSILRTLMGKTHTFGTAVCMTLIVNRVVKKTWEKTVKTRVALRKLTPAELDLYIAQYELSRFAAAYTLNETPWNLITKIDGSYTNVIGLPFEALLPVLRSLKILAVKV